jgi:hypothetical protein
MCSLESSACRLNPTQEFPEKMIFEQSYELNNYQNKLINSGRKG